jgi:hypothetical protein
MAAQMNPEPACDHAAIRWNPMTVEPAPRKGPAQMSCGNFLRQTGKCTDCGDWVVRVSEIVALGPARLLRAIVQGVDPR